MSAAISASKTSPAAPGQAAWSKRPTPRCTWRVARRLPRRATSAAPSCATESPAGHGEGRGAAPWLASVRNGAAQPQRPRRTSDAVRLAPAPGGKSLLWHHPAPRLNRLAHGSCNHKLRGHAVAWLPPRGSLASFPSHRRRVRGSGKRRQVHEVGGQGGRGRGRQGADPRPSMGGSRVTWWGPQSHQVALSKGTVKCERCFLLPAASLNTGSLRASARGAGLMLASQASRLSQPRLPR